VAILIVVPDTEIAVIKKDRVGKAVVQPTLAGLLKPIHGAKVTWTWIVLEMLVDWVAPTI